MDYILKRKLNHNISIEPALPQSGRGDKSYGIAQSFKCYPDGRRKLVRTVDGEEVVSVLTLYLDGTPETETIKAEDRITLWDGRTPPIISVHPFYTERGIIDLVEVNL